MRLFINLVDKKLPQTRELRSKNTTTINYFLKKHYAELKFTCRQSGRS